MVQPYFIAVERFGPYSGEAWKAYVGWSKLSQIEDLVSLDNMLCPTVLPKIADAYWPHIVNEDGLLHFFKDLDFLRVEVTVAGVADARIMCVFRNPAAFPSLPPDLKSFRFYGFDLVETEFGVSALSNCGGWPELDNAEISKWGLLSDHSRALQLQDTLRSAHPEEPHADCDVWAIFAES